MSLLEASSLTKILEQENPVTLVKDATMTIDKGEFIIITGPSGSGKSSLLYLLGLLDEPTKGDVLLEGIHTARLTEEELADLRLSKLGFVFQFHFLLPEFSALENVMLPMRKHGVLDETQMSARASEILGKLGLSDQVDKLPKQLSGGQSQRVAVARALANNPKLIFADEPTGNLDTKSSKSVEELLRGLIVDGDRSVVVVTHDSGFAQPGDRMIRIVDGQITEDYIK